MDAAETNRRIEALRILRGYNQVDLDRLGHAEGLKKQELSRTERGELPMSRVRRHVLSRVLRVPEAWFLDDLDGLVYAVDTVRTLELSTQAAERQHQEALAQIAGEIARQVSRALAEGRLPTPPTDPTTATTPGEG